MLKNLEYFLVGFIVVGLAVGSVIFIPYVVGSIMSNFKFFRYLLNAIEMGPNENQNADEHPAARWFGGFMTMLTVGLFWCVGGLVISMMSGSK